jgi:hypothetical protein
MTDVNAQQRAAQLQHQAEQVIACWQHELEKLELDDAVILPVWSQASFELQRDPASGEESLKGSWRGKHHELLGSMVFHGDGSFYAEYDVIRPHPRREKWFVEAVVAWGRDEVIRSEARLLPMVE